SIRQFLWTFSNEHISRWLVLGHRTCPTTMQEPWDDPLTPNATLRQLLATWFSRRYTLQEAQGPGIRSRARPASPRSGSCAPSPPPTSP
uniref:U-box domain-containing protein n=1 Tax=Aegilops tauschii subsp. strangulata TaxID=200361 RepID=A0A453FXF4_AEGTS